MSAKVTSVTTTMSESDLMENLREFVQVEGLSFNNLEFKNNSIEVTGNFHKVIDIPFYARVHVASVTDNIIRIKLEKIQVLRVGIPNGLLSAGISFAMKKVADMGVTYEAGYIAVDVDAALQKVPFVHVLIDNIIMENGLLAIKVSGINADIKAMNEDKAKKEQAQADEAAENVRLMAAAEKELENFNLNIASMEHTEDEYSKLRRDLEKRVPLDHKQHYEYIAALPDIMALGVRVLRDQRVLPKDKWIIGLTGGYFLSPIDIVPDKLPVLGAFDDLAFFVFGVNHLLNRIPMPIVVEHWSGDLKTLKFLKDNIGKIMGATGSANLDKIYGVVSEKINEKFGEYQDDDFYFRDPIAPVNIEV